MWIAKASSGSLRFRDQDLNNRLGLELWRVIASGLSYCFSDPLPLLQGRMSF
jgi:hypothetical protein